MVLRNRRGRQIGTLFPSKTVAGVASKPMFKATRALSEFKAPLPKRLWTIVEKGRVTSYFEDRRKPKKKGQGRKKTRTIEFSARRSFL